MRLSSIYGLHGDDAKQEEWKRVESVGWEEWKRVETVGEEEWKRVEEVGG